MSILLQLVEWFEQQSGCSDIRVEENYFEANLIDSFDVIMLMEFCESEFGVVFSETQFEDRRFSTITGLSEIIVELQKL